MITKKKVSTYIESIPVVESTLKACIAALKTGELQKAAIIAADDPALIFYLKDLTTKPIYGFSKEIKDPKQIFGILGLTTALAVVESFLFSKILPREFLVFNMKKSDFLNFQDAMLSRWVYVLEREEIENKNSYTPLASLMAATAVFCDRLFADYKEEIERLKELANVNYNTVLEKLTGMNVFDIAVEIGRKWEMDGSALEILQILSQKDKRDGKEKIARYLYLLFFYCVSRPEFVKAKLNEFIELDTEFIQEGVSEFYELMEKYDTPAS